MASWDGTRLLVVRLSSLGDVARALPALDALKRSPAARVDITVEDRFAPLLDLFPIPDRVLPYPRKSAGNPLRHPIGWTRAMADYVASLRASAYDLALDLHGIARSAVVCRLSGAGTTAGYAKDFGKEYSHLLYHRTVRPGSTSRISRYDRYAGALSALGFPAPSPAFLEPTLPREAEEEAEAFLSERGLEREGFVFLFLGTSKRQAVKRWPAFRFGELARLFQSRQGLPTVLGWGPGETELVAAAGGGERCFPIPEWGLHPLLALIRRAKAFVGADTGAMHLAALMGVPTVAIFGPTDPVVNRPFGNRHRIVVVPGVKRPCTGESCSHEHCMGALGAEEVLEILAALEERL